MTQSVNNKKSEMHMEFVGLRDDTRRGQSPSCRVNGNSMGSVDGARTFRKRE